MSVGKKSLLVAALLGLAISPAKAQDVSGWSDLLSPRQVLGAIAQYGVFAVRTQIDFTYGGLSVDPVENRATLYDVVMRRDDWRGICRVRIDRVSLKGSSWTERTAIRLGVEISGLEISPECTPSEIQPAINILQLRSISVPRAAINLRYDLPSGRADMLATGLVDGVGAVTLEAKFDYLAVGPRQGYRGDPELVASLNSAQLQVENGGVWDRVSPLIPPEFTDRATAPARVAQILRLQRDQLIGEMQPTKVFDGYDAFVNSIEGAMVQFISNPSKLIVETSFDPANPVRLDFASYLLSPVRIFGDLRPIVSVQPVAANRVVPLDLLSAVLSVERTLTEEERRLVGLALLSGEGAPRNRERGIDVLSLLSTDAEGEVALAIANALAVGSPERAYPYAQQASRAGASGAIVLLDEIEPRLSAEDLFDLQNGLDDLTADVPSTLLEMRERAVGYFDGRSGRSYVLASYWARLAAAAGDTASTYLLDDITDRIRSIGVSADWQQMEASAADRALRDWVALDLPAHLGLITSP